MKRLEHPHVDVPGLCGPAGDLYAHIHVSCPVDGITYQCPSVHHLTHAVCGHVWTIPWADVDAANGHLDHDDSSAAIYLPPCPACGAITQFGHNDVEYGLEQPWHHTMKAIREHVVTRPRFANLACFPASRLDGQHQGRDFSHLPKHKRPAHHQPVDLSAEYPSEQYAEP